MHNAKPAVALQQQQSINRISGVHLDQEASYKRLSRFGFQEEASAN